MKLLIFFLLISSTTVFGQHPQGTLNINTTGYNNSNGKAIIMLFEKGNEIPKSPFKTLFSPIKDGKAQFQFSDLAYGQYAALLLHDENNNGKIDHFLGLPSEQLGYSNNWQLGFFTGMPSFKKLAFTYSASSQVQQINITYKKNKN
ncbi:DUF2141 domain-containing protein [Pedobacter paludis]|nr:DUF2141 domain-containing protein [Pedobacter paludis]